MSEGGWKASIAVLLSLVAIIGAVTSGVGTVGAATDKKVHQQDEEPLDDGDGGESTCDARAVSDDGPLVPRDNQTVRVGETISIGFLQEHDGETYEWEVVGGDDSQLLHTGTEDIDNRIEHGARVTSFRPETAGCYNISVTVDGSETYIRTIQAIEDESYLGGMSRHELVQFYAPVLNFHPDERFYPTRYEAYVENSNLRRATRLSRAPGVKTEMIDNATLVGIGADYKPGNFRVGSNPNTTDEDTRLDPKTKDADNHAEYQRTVVENEYPETVYASIHDNVEFNGETYTAIGYWTVYIHDPKYNGAPDAVGFAKHTGDQEPIFILLDDEGNAQWIAAQQHKGGELRAWERVQKAGSVTSPAGSGRPPHHPVLYVAQGAHSNYLGPATNVSRSPGQSTDRTFPLRYLYQQQYYCGPDGGPNLGPLVGCQANDAGDPVLTGGVVEVDYQDPTSAQYPGRGKKWAPEGSGANVPGQPYEVTLLTGDEAWSEYEGDVYRYPGDIIRRGSVPPQQNRWESDDPSDQSLTRYVDSSVRPGEQLEVHPDRDQRNGVIADIAETSYTFNGTPDTKTVELSNNGLKPHDYTVTVKTFKKVPGRADPIPSDPDRTNRYAYFLGTGDGERTGPSVGPIEGPTDTEINPNNRSVDIPLSVEGEGEWRVVVELSVYGEDVGDGEREQRYLLDKAGFDVSDSPEGELNITDVPDRNAGGADKPQPVDVVFVTERDGDFYDILEDANTKDRLEIKVGNKTVESEVQLRQSLQGINTNRFGQSLQGLNAIRFVPPTQAEAGEYNLTVSYDGVSDKQIGAISYGEEETTQVAASLQIDRSGSMGGVMSEARQGGIAFVEQTTDADRVSVVSYASNPRVDQSLTSDRRAAVTAIERLNPGGSTNIGGAMNAGLSTLDSAPNGTAKAAILMTDGRRNRGPSRDEILNDIVPQYNERGICIYTIGFTSGADEQLLQDIAEAADCGGYQFAGEAGETEDIRNTLQSVFTDIAGDVSGSDTIESDQGTVAPDESQSDRFRIDNSTIRLVANLRLEGANPSDTQRNVRPLSSTKNNADDLNAKPLVFTDGVQTDANGTDGRSLALIGPDGNRVSSNDTNVSVSAVGDTVIYRIEAPKPGNWTYRIRNNGPNPAEYSVRVSGNTQTELDVTTSGETYYTGNKVDLTASLFGPEGGVRGGTVEATVTGPNGTTTTIDLTDQSAGLYTGTVRTNVTGTYTAIVSAERGALSRQDTVTWRVNETAPIVVTQSEAATALPGESGKFNVSIERTDVAANRTERAVVQLSNLTHNQDNATLTERSLSPDQFNLDSDAQRLNLTVSVPETAPPGEYNGELQLLFSSGARVNKNVSLTVLDPARFEVSIVENNISADAGEPLNATAVIKNTGDVEEDRQVLMSVPGVGLDTADVTLDGSDTTERNFTFPTTAGNATTTVGTVTTGDDTSAVPVDVFGPASFEVVINELPTQADVAVGEQVIVNATVVNLGDEPGQRTVAASVENERIGARVVELNPSEFQFVEFTLRASADRDGDRVTVTAGNATAGVGLSVKDFSVDSIDAPTAVTQGETISVSSEITNEGDQAGTQTVEFRLDTDGNGVIEANESLASQNVSLNPDETTEVTFNDIETPSLKSRNYTYGVFTASDNRTATISVEAANQPPTAKVGENRTVEEETAVMLNASSSSDPDGNSLAYTWTQISGPAVSLSDANTAAPSITTPAVTQATDLTFEVAVTDGQGKTDTDTVTLTVQPVTDDEAFFAVTNLSVPDEVSQGSPLTISATITNTGGAQETQLIEARVDANRNGSQEVIQTQSVTLASGENTTVTTTRTVPANLSTGTYTGGLFTFDSNQTASVTVISEGPSEQNYTRDEIAQAKYGYEFNELSNETAHQVEELYLRQPFADTAQPEDVKTREEIAEARYEEDFENLSRETTIEVQSDFDAQFGDTGDNAEYTRDEISRAKYYGYNFSELSTETSGQVEELYNRQPFADGLSPSDVQTREEIANEKYGLDVDELSRETRIEVEQTYHEQFMENGNNSD